MMGVKDSPELSGMIPRSAALMFQQIAERPRGWKFEIETSYLEIYMERVNDLLNTDNQNLQVREHPTKGVFVQGLGLESLTCLEDVFNIIDRGDKVRKVAATKMNSGSSRSHSVLSIYLEQTDPEGVKMSSQLNLVDLAGSERLDKTGATGEVLKQGTLINLSLTVLSQVISGLSKLADPTTKPQPIPYRDSKLTRLLQTSLGGNAKTGLSIHVSPHVDNIEESISTFEFGKRAKMIKNNAKAKVQRSAEQLERELERLQAAYDKLKKMFEQLSNGKLPAGLLEGGDGASSEELELERQKVQTLEEEADLTRAENDNLKSEIVNLEERLEAMSKAADEARRDAEVKDLEVQTLQAKLRELEADDDEGAPDKGAKGKKGLAASKSSSNASQNAAMAELQALVSRQQEMLNKVRLENKELKQENFELQDEFEEKTRRLALAELQVMRYESARNKIKDSKIKVKIQSGQPKKAGTNWQSIMDQQMVAPASRPKIDYEKVRRGTILEKFGGLHPIPNEELKGGREGHLEERLYQKAKFVRRWFVLRDSFLLCYDSEDSPVTEPRFCIPLAESKVGTGGKQETHEWCFMVLCGTYFLVMAASTEPEKDVWIKDLNLARFVTHEQLVQAAYFSRCSIAAIADPAEQESMRARITQTPYAMLGESEYVHSVPIAGGMEGFLTSPGFKLTDTKHNSMFSRDLRKEWRSYYFCLKDSHLLLYDLQEKSELIPEPSGIVYMARNVAVMEQHDETADPDDPSDQTPIRFYFCVVSMDNDDESLALCASTAEERLRWMTALKAATQITTLNVMVAALERENICALAGITPQEVDLQGRLLDPLCVQPYDSESKPLFRNPNGQTVTRDLVTTNIDVKRFSKQGQPLDFFNRPLPQHAAPMFAANPTEPIGVGVDGRHHAYPSGRILELTDPHYDFEGQPLHPDTVKAADQIIDALKIAAIVRSATLNKDRRAIYDAFGRPLKKTRNGKLLTLEGAELGDGAPVFNAVGSESSYRPMESGAVKTLEIAYMMNDATPAVIGKLGIEVGHTTLADVHAEVKKSLANAKVSSIHFLVDCQPIPEKEKEERIASDYLPRIFVSCRDTHGKRMQFSGKPFVSDVNHEDNDDQAMKEKEAEFMKTVTAARAGKKPTGRSPRSTSPRSTSPRA
eukprot:c38815_g1_i1.p1 GENE.c38815_g1_i1~~c38815_g1_i1.p1  ORF type:complete len:1260 (+),score=236.66 c38815_g1_i1:326-3781(+)